jgi:hypothetical protein
MRRYVPQPDSGSAANDICGRGDLLDHLVCPAKQRKWKGEAERLGGL